VTCKDEEKNLRKLKIERILSSDALLPSMNRKMHVFHNAFGFGYLKEMVDFSRKLFKIDFNQETITMNIAASYKYFTDNECIDKIINIIDSPYEEDKFSIIKHENNDIMKKDYFEYISSECLYYERVNSLAYYNSKEHDSFTSHILGFKEGYSVSVQLIMKLLDQLIPCNMYYVDYIIRAYGHNEGRLQQKPIDKIGEFLADRLSAEYKPLIIKRVKVNHKLSGMGHAERIQEISGVYEVQEELIDFKKKVINILVIDDVTTSGATLSEIAKTLYKVSSNIKLYGFCLGQTIKHNMINEYYNDPINKLIKKIEKENQQENCISNSETENTTENTKVKDMDIFEDLAKYKNITFTDQQKKAVLHTNGPALVLAVPGSGKTTTLMGRTANLIYQKFAMPEEILSVTFSKASAEDMSKRFNTLFDFISIPKVMFSTIHRFCYSVIKHYAKMINVKYILIEGDSAKGINKNKIISSLYKNLTKKYLSENELESIMSCSSYLKNIMADEKEVERVSDELYREEGIYGFAELLKQFENEKKKLHYLDFDDLLTFSYEILCDNSNILKHYQHQYKFIQVDEGQDTSLIQHMIIKLLAKEHNNVFYVADDDQSIYRFRGSTPEYLLNFEKNYNYTDIYRMEQNFRSTQKIVGLANVFIKKNQTRYKKNIFTENEDGEKIDIHYNSEVDADEIVDLILNEGKLNDNAILYRENLSALSVIATLMMREIPFYIKDFSKIFFTHWTIIDIFSISEFAVNSTRIDLFEKFYFKLSGFYISKDMVNEIKKDKTDTSTYDKLKAFANNDKGKSNIERLERQMNSLANMEPTKAIDYIINVLGFGEFLLKREPSCKKLDDVKGYHFIKALDVICIGIKSFSELRDYMEDLKDAINRAGNNKEKDAVVLSTLHSSKGLEWKNVYLIDIKNGIFPNNKNIESSDPTDIEEERRLCYVGITRAKKKLRIYGERGAVFINEITDVLDHDKIKKAQINNTITSNLSLDSKSIGKLKTQADQQIKDEVLCFNDLTEGLFVRHVKYGEGCILEYDESRIYILFDNGLEKVLETSFCLAKKILFAI